MAAARGRAGGHGTSRGVTTTMAADAGDAAAGFDFGDAARMAAEFAPILGGAPRRAARPLGRARATRTRTRTPRTRTRTRMHTLARMFARFCFHVSHFVLCFFFLRK